MNMLRRTPHTTSIPTDTFLQFGSVDSAQGFFWGAGVALLWAALVPFYVLQGLVSLLIVWFGIAAMVPVMQNVNCRRSQTPTVAMASITSSVSLLQ